MHNPLDVDMCIACKRTRPGGYGTSPAACGLAPLSASKSGLAAAQLDNIALIPRVLVTSFGEPATPAVFGNSIGAGVVPPVCVEKGVRRYC